MYLIMASVFSMTLYAEELKVQHGLFNYRLEYTEEMIELSGEKLELSLYKSECNQDLISKFGREVSGMQKLIPKKTKQENTLVKIQSGSQTSYVPKTSRPGQFFLQLPEQFKTLKIRELIRCKKKND